MTPPLISVVMIACNVEPFLAEAIESILGQTFRDFEFIIVDSGSTDGSKAIICSYAAKDNRIKFHEILPCVLPAARNAGSFLAQGRYIAVMDADDISVPDRLEREVEFMEKHPEVGFLGGATEWIDSAGRSLYIDYLPTENHELKSALVAGCRFAHPTVLMRREAFLLVGGYRKAFILAQDYDLWLRIAEHFQCANLKQVMLKYRIHPYQLSLRKQRQQTYCKLAAQASASARKKGNPDPLNEVEEITPALLAELGVSEARKQCELASDCRNWIRGMSMAGEYAAALQAAVDLLQSDTEYVERWQIADLHLTMARLYWRQERFLSSFLAAGHALLTRPMVVGRPLKPLLRRLGLVRLRTQVGDPQETVDGGQDSSPFVNIFEPKERR